MTFRSGLEQRIADNLTGRNCEYEYELMSVAYFIEHKYKPDFVLPNGIIIEAKGYFRYKEQRMHRSIKEQHPELDIRFVFSNMNSRVQGSRLTCANWCKKHNFLCSEKIVPHEWTKDVKKKRN